MSEGSSVRRRAVNLHEQPAALATLAHHRHPVRVLLLALLNRGGLSALGKKPADRPRRRKVKVVPIPRVGRQPST